MSSLRSIAFGLMAGAVAVMSFATPQALAAAECSVEKARYVSMADQQWTAGFVPIKKSPDWISDLAFFVRSAQSKKTYWFMFDAGTARYVNLISTFDVTKPGWHPPGPDGPATERPYGEMHYLSADRDLTFSLDIPTQRKPVPMYILLPDLPELMWYGTPPMEREGAPLAFFKLQPCG